MEILTEKEGLITQIIGPVIDVEFQNGNLPKIYDALEMYNADGQKLLRKFNNIWAKTKFVRLQCPQLMG